jgi:hypothetical protein
MPGWPSGGISATEEASTPNGGREAMQKVCCKVCGRVFEDEWNEAGNLCPFCFKLLEEMKGWNKIIKGLVCICLVLSLFNCFKSGDLTTCTDEFGNQNQYISW